MLIGFSLLFNPEDWWSHRTRLFKFSFTIYAEKKMCFVSFFRIHCCTMPASVPLSDRRKSSFFVVKFDVCISHDKWRESILWISHIHRFLFNISSDDLELNRARFYLVLTFPSQNHECKGVSFVIPISSTI